MKFMSRNLGFRAWFYFRNGWSMYFAFIFAAINTLTVTYYLAIEKIPALVPIFPTFIHYIVIITSIGIPLLVIVGYAHWKRTKARKAEVDIGYETDPYKSRTLVNTQINLILNLRMSEMLLKLSKNEKSSSDDLEEIENLRKELVQFLEKRTFTNKKDLDFIRQELDKS